MLQIIKDDFGDSMRFLRKELPGILNLLFLAALASFIVLGVVAVGFPFLCAQDGFLSDFSQ